MSIADITNDYRVWCFARGTMQHLQSYTCSNMPKFTSQLLCQDHFYVVLHFFIYIFIYRYKKRKENLFPSTIGKLTQPQNYKQQIKWPHNSTSTLPWEELRNTPTENNKTVAIQQTRRSLHTLKKKTKSDFLLKT